MGLIVWIVIGAIAGWLASAVVASPRAGCMTNIAIGMLGGVIGGILWNATAGEERSSRLDFSVQSLLVATVGAIVLLLVLNLAGVGRIGRKKATGRRR